MIYRIRFFYILLFILFCGVVFVFPQESSAQGNISGECKYNEDKTSSFIWVCPADFAQGVCISATYSQSYIYGYTWNGATIGSGVSGSWDDHTVSYEGYEYFPGAIMSSTVNNMGGMSMRFYEICRTPIEIETYDLDISTEGDGYITVDPPGKIEYVPGSTADLTARPDSGWEFSHWEDATSGTTIYTRTTDPNNDGDADPETFRVTMDSDKYITAVFKEKTPFNSPSPGCRYMFPEPGGPTGIPSAGEYYISYTGNSDFGYYGGNHLTSSAIFVWNGERLTLGLFGDHQTIPWVHHEGFRYYPGELQERGTFRGGTTRGIFEICRTPIETYTLTTNIVGEGSITVSPDRIEYDLGSTVDLTATPDSGWNFVEWTGLSVDDLSDTEATSNTITMDSNKSVTAVFEETGSGPGPGPGPGPGSVPPGPGPGPGGGPLDISCEATGDSVEEQNGETRSHVNRQITFTADVDPLTPGSTYTYDWSSVDIPQVESRTGESIDVLPRTIGDHTVEVEVEEKNSSGITLATATCEINHTVFIDPQYEEF